MKTINDVRSEWSYIQRRIKLQEAYEDCLWDIENHIWHFGFDTEGNVVKIEPYKVVSFQ